MTIERQESARRPGRPLQLRPSASRCSTTFSASITRANVGADIIARFYGNASTFPEQQCSRDCLQPHSKAHLNKLLKADEKSIGVRLRRSRTKLERHLRPVPASKILWALPGFPGQLEPLREQGRFALGFHQQKAHEQRAAIEKPPRSARDSASATRSRPPKLSLNNNPQTEPDIPPTTHDLLEESPTHEPRR